MHEESPDGNGDVNVTDDSSGSHSDATSQGAGSGGSQAVLAKEWRAASNEQPPSWVPVVEGYDLTRLLDVGGSVGDLANGDGVIAVAMDDVIAIVDGNEVVQTKPLEDGVADLLYDGGVLARSGDRIERYARGGFVDREREVADLVGLETVSLGSRVAAIDADGTVTWLTPERLRVDGTRDLPIDDVRDPVTAGGRGVLVIGTGRELVIVRDEEVSVTEFNSSIEHLGLVDETVIVGTERWTLGVDSTGRRVWQANERLGALNGYGHRRLFGATESSLLTFNADGVIDTVEYEGVTALGQSPDDRAFVTACKGSVVAYEREEQLGVDLETDEIDSADPGSLALSFRNEAGFDRTVDAVVSLDGIALESGDRSIESFARKLMIDAGGSASVSFDPITVSDDAETATVRVRDSITETELLEAELPIARQAPEVSLSATATAIDGDAIDWSVTVSNDGTVPTDGVLRDSAGTRLGEPYSLDSGESTTVEAAFPVESHPVSVTAVQGSDVDDAPSSGASTDGTGSEPTVTLEGPSRALDFETALVPEDDHVVEAFLEIEGTAEFATDGTLTVSSPVLSKSFETDVSLSENDEVHLWLPVPEIPYESFDTTIEVGATRYSLETDGVSPLEPTLSVESMNGDEGFAADVVRETLTVRNVADESVDADELDEYASVFAGDASHGTVPPGVTRFTRYVATFGTETFGDEGSGFRDDPSTASRGGSGTDTDGIVIKPYLVSDTKEGGVRLYAENRSSRTFEIRAIRFEDIASTRFENPIRLRPGESGFYPEAGPTGVGEYDRTLESIPVKLDIGRIDDNEVFSVRALAPVLRLGTSNQVFDVSVADVDGTTATLSITNTSTSSTDAIELVEEKKNRFDTDSVRLDALATGAETRATIDIPAGRRASQTVGVPVTLSTTIGHVNVTESFFVNGDIQAWIWDVHHESTEDFTLDSFPETVASKWRIQD